MRFGLFLGANISNFKKGGNIFYEYNTCNLFCLSTQTINRPTCILNYRYNAIFAGIYNSIPVPTVKDIKVSRRFISQLFQKGCISYLLLRCPSVNFQIKFLYLLIISLNLTLLSDRCSLLFDGALRSPETHGIFPNPRGDAMFLAGCSVLGLVLD